MIQRLPSFLKTPFAQGSRNTETRRLMLGSILFLACFLAYAPLYPRLPEDSLDPSWMLAMNQAVAQGLVFGRDIVFTFGPYSALYTQAYHPATYASALFVGSLLALCYGGMLLVALRKQWLWLYAGFLFFLDSRDALFFSYSLLVVLVGGMATLNEMDPRKLAFPRGARIGYACAIALLGTLPLAKGSFLPLSVVAALAGSILFWLKGEKIFALLFVLLPTLTMVALWQMAGQPITALPDYFRSMSPIISGFSEAMSVYGDSPRMVEKIGIPGMIGAYMTVAALILVSILRDRRNSILHKVAMTSCVGLFLFIAFKAGFVRHDSHALAASSALVLAAISLLLFGVARISLLTVASAFLVWGLTHLYYERTSLKQTIIPSLYGVMLDDRMGRRLQTAFIQRLDEIKVASAIPKLEGTTDIYPYDQAALIASGNDWASRPILQSYSAYTPGLARMNEAHLRGVLAPDNIVFRVATIDKRYPTLDDGLSWPTLLARYAISATDKNYVYLKRRPTPSDARKTAVMEENYELGKEVNLPQGPHILFAEIDVVPTVLGRLAQVVFKPAPLHISVSLADGHNETYRLIPSMARTGLVLSPLIRSTTDFIHLAEGQFQSLEPNRIKSFRIEPAWGGFWKREYLLSVSFLEANPPAAPPQQNKMLPRSQ